jgi:hypothetical protein
MSESIHAPRHRVVLKLATEGSKACNRKVEVRRNAAKAAGRASLAQVSSDGFDESDRSQPAYQKVLERHPGTRCRIGAEVFVAGVSGVHRAPKHRR